MLSRLVLQPVDVGIPRYDVGPITALGEPGGPPGGIYDAGGWEALYKLSGAPARTPVLLVDSRARAFATSAAARNSFDAQRKALNTGAAAHVTAVPLGDGGAASSQVQQATSPVRYWTFVWRDDTVASSLVVAGAANQLSFSRALRLARLQERRIRNVLR